MPTFAKTLVIGAAAVLSSATAFAEEPFTATFRYDRTQSLERNYAAFEITAKRACNEISPLTSRSMLRKCRSSLVDQAVAATRQAAFIALHAARTGADRQVASLDPR